MQVDEIKILIVDDNSIDSELLIRYISKSFNTAQAKHTANGKTAIQQLKSEDYSIVFIDYMLPDISGLDLIETINDMQLPYLPVLVMVTGQGNEKVAVEAMKLGASDYLVKADLSIETVSRIVLSAIEKSALKAQLQMTKDKAEYLSIHDKLTGLYNRDYFTNNLFCTLEQNNKRKTMTIIMLLNIDNFQNINNVYGHDIGDSVIIQIAGFLENDINGTSVVARHSGDEFVIQLENNRTTEDASNIAKKILHYLHSNMIIKDQRIKMSSSIGIACAPNAGDAVNLLMENVDIAMHRAKKSGKAKYSFYSEELDATSKKILDIEIQLSQAIEKNELSIVYQPIIDLKNNKVVSFESLLRWNNDKYGFIPPDEFIEIAEKSHLIIEIGNWVIENSLKEFGDFCSNENASYNISINISSNQLTKADSAKKILALIDESGFNKKQIVFELTERAIINDFENIIEQFRQLTAAGIKIYIDDFGTGNSSLIVLNKLPITCLKIDKSFTDNVLSEDSAKDIISNVILLSHSLSLINVIEGIEQKEQLEKLIELGGLYGQGYFFAKPMPVSALHDYIKGSIK
ncbi:MAG: EAL domain-containing protein [Coxiellaceae bacterium]|nr:EAL domain-containing protein [Coxiellaceae bacterium]